MPGEKYPPKNLAYEEPKLLVEGATSTAKTVAEHAARAVIGIVRRVGNARSSKVEPLQQTGTSGFRGAGDIKQIKSRKQRKQRKQRKIKY